VIAEVVAGSLGELIKAGVAILRYRGEKEDLRRSIISTALEDAKWTVFTDIEP
jgi:hypothetical protein